MSATNTLQAFLSIFTPGSDGVTPNVGLIDGGGTGAVTQTGTPSMSVLVTSASWLVYGPNPTTQGVFMWSPGGSTQTVGPFDAADATNPRIDIVVVTVNDPGTLSTAGDASYQIVKGTPAASPSAPPTPLGSSFVRQVRINAAATSITNANITGTPSKATLRTNTATVTAPNRTAPKVAWGQVTASTDSSGYLTWSHGLGSTPGAISVETVSPNGGSGAAAQHFTDTYTSSTARTRWLTQTGGTLASVSVTFRFIAFG